MPAKRRPARATKTATSAKRKAPAAKAGLFTYFFWLDRKYSVRF